MDVVCKNDNKVLRDKHVDIMLFWGILFVVMGHNYQPQWFFFPAYAFHMAFFFFISGYLFKVKETIKEKMFFILRKIKTQLIPYFFINLGFGIISYFLVFYGIHLTSGLTLHNLFVEPFITGHQFSLNIPAWFIVNLFLINLIAQIILFKNSRTLKILLFLIILPITIFAIYKGLNKYNDFRLTLVRTSFGLLFFFIGVLFSEFKNFIIKIIKSPFLVLILWSIVSILTAIYGKISYSIVFGNIENENYIIPLITTFLIVFISYILCYYTTFFIDNNSFLLKIGENSFYIMFFHLSVFFLINLFLYRLRVIQLSSLSNVYYSYFTDKLFLFYQIPALLIPIFLGIYITKLKNKIKFKTI